MNTAQLRNAAHAAEQRLEWAAAADLYEQAANKYPGRGALAEADIAGLRARAKQCRVMVRS